MDDAILHGKPFAIPLTYDDHKSRIIENGYHLNSSAKSIRTFEIMHIWDYIIETYFNFPFVVKHFAVRRTENGLES